MDARETALTILMKMESDHAYSTATLSSMMRDGSLSVQDTQFVFALVYGVTERKMTLDYFLSGHLQKPLRKLDPRVLTILRMGAYQILYMDKIPMRAAVNEAVNACKKHGSAYASGLVNAVLRKIGSNDCELPQTDNMIYNQSIRYSCSEWIVRLLTDTYGSEVAENVLQSAFGRHPVYVRVNTNKTNVSDLLAVFASEGVEAEMTDMPECIHIGKTGDLSGLQSFRDGLYHVQDLSSQKCCEVLDAQPGDYLVDCCAAPGGKTFSSAYKMNDTGRIVSCDIHPFKTDIMQSGAERLGLQCVQTLCADAVTLGERLHDADRVLCDVPCSGLGVIGRKPEIKYKSYDEIKELPALQLRILSSCSRIVKHGGILVYSTCTWNKSENEDVCDTFLLRNTEFYRCCKDTVILPDADRDGFFISKMMRK